MKTCFSLLTVCVLALPSWAQLSSLPPPSVADGIIIRPLSNPLESTSWSASPLSYYRMSADNSFATPGNGGTDMYGQKWSSIAPNRDTLIGGGGTFRGIVLGAPSPAPHAIGYSYSGTPEGLDSYTLSYHSNENDPAFGDRVDIRLAAGELDLFDFWVSTPSGTYTVFSPGNSSSASGVSAEVLWTEAPLLISTFIPALNDTALVETWIVSVVEQNGPGGARSEFRFGFQQFPFRASNSGPPSGAPVPEPSTYVLAGAALCGLLIVRRTVGRK